jgi:hypothetical protein
LETAQSFHRAAAVVLALILTLCLAAPALDATETAEQPAGKTESAEAADPEKGGDEEATEKKKKGPSFIAIPIFITEPAIGYGLGGAVAHFHRKSMRPIPARVRIPQRSPATPR